MNLEPLVPRILRRRKAPPAGLREPPVLSGALPVVGHTVEFVRSTIGLLARAQRELGEAATIEIVGKRMVAVFGPDAHEAVFRAPDSALNPSEAYKNHDADLRQGRRLRRPAGADERAAQDAPAGPQGPAHAHLRRDRRLRGGAEHRKLG
ncbi:MAG: hypothetical protein QM820_44780 [Minicystis sp.]